METYIVDADHTKAECKTQAELAGVLADKLHDPRFLVARVVKAPEGTEIEARLIAANAMTENERIRIVPDGGASWTSVGGQSLRGFNYVGFVVPLDSKYEPVGVMGDWMESDIAQWALGYFETTMKEMKDKSPELVKLRYEALIQQLSTIVYDVVVKSRPVPSFVFQPNP
jgi:hypothetical protein